MNFVYLYFRYIDRVRERERELHPFANIQTASTMQFVLVIYCVVRVPFCCLPERNGFYLFNLKSFCVWPCLAAVRAAIQKKNTKIT